MAEKIGELLVRDNLITPAQLQKALEEQKRTGGRLGANLCKLGFIKEEQLTEFLSKQYGVPAVNLKEFEIDAEVIKLIPEEVARKHVAIPVNRAGNTLIVAMADPSNIFAQDDIKFLTGYNVEVVVAPEASIKEAIEKHYQAASDNMEDMLGDMEDMDIELSQDSEEVNLGELEKASEEAPVIKLVNLILTDAIKKKASDIHVEPYEKAFRVRYRIDGMLYEVLKPPMKMRNPIVSRIKIMSGMDIAERRLPQDGRIKIKHGKDKEMDYRVSVVPTLFGEKVVMRLLDKSNLQLDMTKLGFNENQIKLFKDAINRPYGMVLVTGPTGSGKTTTLYSALSELNQIDVNICTAEDPVEYNMMGINQVQMHEEIGLNFAAALRAFLRQDPDIILVGEIRDFETAEIAVKAALTGHLVLSTLHTNDAPSTVNRLLNMGVEPFLVASSVNLILAQRLVRKVCQECKEPQETVPKMLIDMGMNPELAKDTILYKGKGCSNCSDTGYKGRLACYEVMMLYEETKELILNGASAAEIKKEGMRLGMESMRMSGLAMIRQGVTTPDEVMRVTASDF